MGLKLEGFSLEVLLSQFHRLRLRWSVLCFLGLRQDSPLGLEAALHDSDCIQLSPVPADCLY